MKRRIVLFALVILCGIGLSACSTVQPWERGTFASYEMKPGRDPIATAMAEHVYFSREAASGGGGVGGSGCGCN